MSRLNQKVSSRVAWNKGQTKETNEALKCSSRTLSERYRSGELTPSFKGRHHTKATRKKLSEIRIKYLKEHKDDHPWKKGNKFTSEPCEKLKEIFRENDLNFFEEYTDKDWSHAYSIDIAFPEKKLAVEVNRKSTLQ